MSWFSGFGLFGSSRAEPTLGGFTANQLYNLGITTKSLMEGKSKPYQQGEFHSETLEKWKTVFNAVIEQMKDIVTDNRLKNPRFYGTVMRLFLHDIPSFDAFIKGASDHSGLSDSEDFSEEESYNKNANAALIYATGQEWLSKQTDIKIPSLTGAESSSSTPDEFDSLLEQINQELDAYDKQLKQYNKALKNTSSTATTSTPSTPVKPSLPETLTQAVDRLIPQLDAVLAPLDVLEKNSLLRSRDLAEALLLLCEVPEFQQYLNSSAQNLAWLVTYTAGAQKNDEQEYYADDLHLSESDVSDHEGLGGNTTPISSPVKKAQRTPTPRSTSNFGSVSRSADSGLPGRSPLAKIKSNTTVLSPDGGPPSPLSLLPTPNRGFPGSSQRRLRGGMRGAAPTNQDVILDNIQKQLSSIQRSLSFRKQPIDSHQPLLEGIEGIKRLVAEYKEAAAQELATAQDRARTGSATIEKLPEDISEALTRVLQSSADLAQFRAILTSIGAISAQIGQTPSTTTSTSSGLSLSAVLQDLKQSVEGLAIEALQLSLTTGIGELKSLIETKSSETATAIATLGTRLDTLASSQQMLQVLQILGSEPTTTGSSSHSGSQSTVVALLRQLLARIPQETEAAQIISSPNSDSEVANLLKALTTRLESIERMLSPATAVRQFSIQSSGDGSDLELQPLLPSQQSSVQPVSLRWTNIWLGILTVGVIGGFVALGVMSRSKS